MKDGSWLWYAGGPAATGMLSKQLTVERWTRDRRVRLEAKQCGSLGMRLDTAENGAWN